MSGFREKERAKWFEKLKDLLIFCFCYVVSLRTLYSNMLYMYAQSCTMCFSCTYVSYALLYVPIPTFNIINVLILDTIIFGVFHLPLSLLKKA